MSKSQTVYPVEGHYIDGVPHIEHECSDPFCVESGAFTTTKPKPPPRVADQTEEAPKGASSDSTEA